MTITEDQVNEAQQAWCDGLVEIGRIHQAGGNVRAAALALISDLYDCGEGVVFLSRQWRMENRRFETRQNELCHISWEGIPTSPMTRDLL